jgi:hypothetical protein
MQVAQELQLHGFKASSSWLYDFKVSHSIVSRKILRVLTPRMVVEERNIEQSAENFLAEVRTLMASEPDREVFNADQSGFVKELHSGRTLETRGAKGVGAIAQSIEATTHSYTILPTISASGRLMSAVHRASREDRPVPCHGSHIPSSKPASCCAHLTHNDQGTDEAVV